MTAAPKGRRLGGPPTISTLDDPTGPEAPPARAAALVPAAAPDPVELPHLVDVQLPSAPSRPRAEDIVQRRTGDIPREQINAMTPQALELARRMGYYKLDHGFELRDQVALALDGWLSAQGY